MQKETFDRIRWPNVFVFFLYHIIGLEGIYYLLTLQVQWKTVLFTLIILYASGQGITSGVHRLWSHKAYQANLPLRIMLAAFQTMCFQNSIFEWARDHRVHHRFTDTDADPHNSKRGFFFCHMGWLLVRKHPDIFAKGSSVDVRDLKEDAVVQFQHKYYTVLAPLMCFVVPTVVPWYFWGENWYIAFTTAGMVRYLMSLHFTWLVNSAAHMWGTKPYDSSIIPVQNVWVTYLTQGEGWHNYHHTFPWDYKAAELDTYNGNLSTAFIDFMAKMGWAWDLKTVDPNVVKKRMMRTGDRKIFEKTL